MEKSKQAKTKLPSFQFYPGDWMKDPALAICSAGARGIWMDVLCLMFESPRRGYLITNGIPWTLEQIAVGLRGDWQENLIYLKELVHNGVMKRVQAKRPGRKCPRNEGAFYSARIVSDECQRDVWRAQKHRQRIENKRSLSTPLSTLSSSSSSSSSSKLNTKTPLPPVNGGKVSHDDLLKDEKNYSYMAWGSGHIVIRTGRNRRVLSKNEIDGMIGARIEDVVLRIRRKGFWAEIYEAAETPAATGGHE